MLDHFKQRIDLLHYLTATFFGCEVPAKDVLDPKVAGTRSNPTNTYQTKIALVPPFIIYMPNAPVDPKAKVAGLDSISTFTRDVTQAQLVVTQDNAIKHATRGINASWSQCMACAVMERSRQRAYLARSAACQTCFKGMSSANGRLLVYLGIRSVAEYCWVNPQGNDKPEHTKSKRSSKAVEPEIVDRSWPSFVR